MFRPERMKRVSALFLDTDVLPFLLAVGRAEAVEPVDIAALGADWERFVAPAGFRELAASYASLERRATVLAETLGLEGEAEATADFDLQADKQRAAEVLTKMEDTVGRIRRQTDEVGHEIEHLRLLGIQLGWFRTLDVRIEDLRDLTYLHLVAGSVPEENLERLHTSLATIPHVLLTQRQPKGRVVILLFGAAIDADALERAARSAYVEKAAAPPGLSGRIEEALRQIQAKITVLSERRSQLAEELAAKGQAWRDNLLELKKRLSLEKTLAETLSRLGKTEETQLLSGWLPSSKLAVFSSVAEQSTNGRVYWSIDGPRDAPSESPVPTILHNPPAIKPFEKLVTTFGLPSYDEIDPTFFAALTFLIMFGVMFGDVGQGLVLSALGFVIASGKFRFASNVADLGRMLTDCGLSSALFGLLYGSVFGYEAFPPLWVRPLENAQSFLLVGVGFGIILLSFGLVLNIVNRVQQADFKEALLGEYGLASTLFYWGSIGVVALWVASGATPSLWLILAVLGVPLAAVLMSEPLYNLTMGSRPIVPEGAASYLVLSGFKVFDLVVRLLSNTVSFIRIAAFAISHEALAATVFIIANLLAGTALSGVPSLLIIILGNVFIIGFEGLIVAIQGLRLEYYEFFTKFFTGRGVPFQPLKLR